jgi:arylformamidase
VIRFKCHSSIGWSVEVELYDISQTLQEGIAVWPGDPELKYRWAMRIQKGEPCNVAEVDMGVHTGTHLDAPLHLDDSGGDAASIPIRSCMGAARVYAISANECIRAVDLDPLDWRSVERVLFKTRLDSLPGRKFDQNYVYLGDDASEFLVQRGILLVGADTPSVDAFKSKSLPSHRILLRHGIVILENARLEKVPPGDYELICLPLKLAGLDGSPVRAILWKK